MAVSRSIDLLYPPFARELLAGIERARIALKLDIAVFETYRSPSRQDILFEQGRRMPGSIVTNTRGWGSWHQYGLAADVALLIDKKWSWEFNPEELAKYITGTRLKWGGVRDGPHYQWGKLPALSVARKICREGDGVLALWSTL